MDPFPVADTPSNPSDATVPANPKKVNLPPFAPEEPGRKTQVPRMAFLFGPASGLRRLCFGTLYFLKREASP